MFHVFITHIISRILYCTSKEIHLDECSEREGERERERERAKERAPFGAPHWDKTHTVEQMDETQQQEVRSPDIFYIKWNSEISYYTDVMNEHSGDLSSAWMPFVFSSCSSDSAAGQRTVSEDKDFQDAPHKQQMKPDDNCLLAELVRIEQDLREKARIEEERRREEERVRQKENRKRWRSLCFLVLNQRTAKPWVTSYYTNIPMHIYCLPIESANQQPWKRKKKKKKECN
ncbi:uncharacterized protein LOC124400811 [Silurus meridionalis]|uniref:uncharacterized protein LOC124400811 n=1 Tax=Silurus meridionalis TaxID=175797 RepID=UPI001EEA2C63|nr:uncharacterized protein LOC124400811 [Silurus meridionalis]